MLFALCIPISLDIKARYLKHRPAGAQLSACSLGQKPSIPEPLSGFKQAIYRERQKANQNRTLQHIGRVAIYQPRNHRITEGSGTDR